MENDEILKNLLKEYEQKHNLALKELDERKNRLYSKHPQLKEIENELHSLGINTAKAIISNNDSTYLNNLKTEIENLRLKQNEIFKSLNIDESYLKPNYECKICNDTGYLTNNFQTSMCSCLKQKLLNIEYNKSNIYNLDKENFNSFNYDLYSDVINKEKYNSDISPRENIKNIKNISENFINNFDDPNSNNLLFTGNTGLGKTFISNCIANEILKLGKTVLYQTTPVMLDTIIDYRFGKNNSQNICDYIYTVDLLIMDDLGTETINSLKSTELYNIINTRLLNQKKTIISTNLNIKNLYDNYDERIVSRFIGHYDICKFFGDDIRFKKIMAK